MRSCAGPRSRDEEEEEGGGRRAAEVAIAAYDAVDPLPVARDDPENVHGPRATRVSRAARRRREAEVNQEDSVELGVRCGGSSFTLREAIRTRGGWEWAPAARG